jgi:hypothetical protein
MNAEHSMLLVRSTRMGLWTQAAKETYALHLITREVRRASNADWERGIPVEARGCVPNGAYCGPEWTHTKKDEPLVIDGLELPKSGRYWPSATTTSAVPSPGKTWILIQSYSGKTQNSFERWGAQYGHLIRGTGYIQLVRMKDARELFQIRFQIRHEWPTSFATVEPWLEEDLLVLDVLPSHRRLLICRID